MGHLWVSPSPWHWRQERRVRGKPGAPRLGVCWLQALTKPGAQLRAAGAAWCIPGSGQRFNSEGLQLPIPSPCRLGKPQGCGRRWGLVLHSSHGPGEAWQCGPVVRHGLCSQVCAQLPPGRGQVPPTLCAVFPPGDNNVTLLTGPSRGPVELRSVCLIQSKCLIWQISKMHWRQISGNSWAGLFGL